MTTNYDGAIKQLTDAMRYKLHANRHKGDIGDMSPKHLISLLRAEVDELEGAISRGNPIEMILEAGDVCNFAMCAVINAARMIGEDVGVTPSPPVPNPSELPQPITGCFGGGRPEPSLLEQAVPGYIRIPDKYGVQPEHRFFTPQGLWSENSKPLSTMWKDLSGDIYYENLEPVLRAGLRVLPYEVHFALDDMKLTLRGKEMPDISPIP